jgi:pyruvate kinase
MILALATDYSHLGTNECIACSYKDLPTSVQVGKVILIADGSVSAKVVKVESGIVTV